MKYRSEDIDSVGFRRDALLAFLALDGIDLKDAPVAPKPVMKPAPPWANARRGLRRLSLPEAANVLIGFDPLDTEWRGDDEWREFEGAKRVLLEAVEAKELPIADIDFNNNAVEIFNIADVRAWAQAAGYSWPIPEMPAISIAATTVASGHAGDGELLQRLQTSERERNEYRSEVERLKGDVQRFGDQTAKLVEQAEQLGKLQADLAAAKTEMERLKTEMAQGKSLSALQKLVVGMALDSYNYKPDEAKSPVTKQIADDLAKHGISIDTDTVRRHLKRAAEMQLSGAQAI